MKIETQQQHEELTRRLLQGMQERNNKQRCNQCVQEFQSLYSSKIRAWIRQTSSNLNDHDVLVLQNTVLFNVWRSAGTYNGASLVSNWLQQITRNAVIDYIRSGRKEVQLPEDWFDVEVDVGDDHQLYSMRVDGPEEQKMREEFKFALDDCVENLTEKHKQTLKAVFLDELSYNEVASRLSTKTGTVKSRINIIRERLRLCMRGKGFVDLFSMFSRGVR